VAGSLAASDLEESLWLRPIEDRRQLDSSRKGMFDGLSFLPFLSPPFVSVRRLPFRPFAANF
jgi:hypothetical protein